MPKAIPTLTQLDNRGGQLGSIRAGKRGNMRRLWRQLDYGVMRAHHRGMSLSR